MDRKTNLVNHGKLTRFNPRISLWNIDKSYSRKESQLHMSSPPFDRNNNCMDFFQTHEADFEKYIKLSVICFFWQ